MSIEIKKSEKPVIYEDAKKMMEERLLNVDVNKSNELIELMNLMVSRSN